MKLIKKILVAFLILIGLFLIFSIWYKYEYSMDPVDTREVNNSSLDKKLLIATQGSDFKNELTNEIVNHFRTDSLYIKIVDISSLHSIDIDDYNAILIVHTWENWKAPKTIQSFMDSGKYDSEKMIVFTTSGEGSYKMENIDALTGASNMDNIVVHVDAIVKQLNLILNKNN